jgi:4-hydroxybenzoate polyprenyltransferase
MSTPARIIRSNIWISLSASIITAYFSIAFGANYDRSLCWLITSAFLSTFAIYTFYRFPFQLWLWIIPGGLALLVSFTSNALNVVIGVNLLLCLLYQTPFSRFPLRNNPWAKPLLIAACWLNTIWLAPLLQYALPVWESMATNFSQQAGLPPNDAPNFMRSQWESAIANGIAILCVYYALCILTDLNQMKEDHKNGFKSFPVKYGPKTSFIASLLLLVPMLCFVFIHFPFSLFMIEGIDALAWVLGSTIVALLIYKRPNQTTNVFWVDNIIGLIALSFLILHFISKL